MGFGCSNQALADGSSSLPLITCRVAIVGCQRQRVAKVASLLRLDASRRRVAAAATTVAIEYLPCVATFDSYEDASGASVRYLAKLEYHGPEGTLATGRSLAPFFEDAAGVGGDAARRDGCKDPFPGVTAAAIGCGIDDEEDVAQIRGLLDTLSATCELPACKRTGEDHQHGPVVECVKPNSEYTSMKEENEFFRGLSQDEKNTALEGETLGPGKMAAFVFRIAEDVVRKRLSKDFSNKQSSYIEDSKSLPPPLETLEVQSEPSMPEYPPDVKPSATHAPNPEKKRYACRRCRAVLFGEDDLENPPHTPAQHNFSKRGRKAGLGRGAAASCQNHCLTEPLSWMGDCGGAEGKLFCPRCAAKVGHYAWAGGQCSCGTWVTPAIMVAVGRVDEMKPASHDVIAESGALVANHRGFAGAPPRPLADAGLPYTPSMVTQRIASMAIIGDSASSLEK